MWDRRALHELIDSRLRDQRLIVVANREPYIHRYVGDAIDCMRPASGMVTALDPMMLACGGTWIATALAMPIVSRSTRTTASRVPPGEPALHLAPGVVDQGAGRRLLPRPGQRGLWPLCHVVFTRPIFEPDHWQIYREVNELFADAVLEEAGDRPDVRLHPGLSLRAAAANAQGRGTRT